MTRFAKFPIVLMAMACLAGAATAPAWAEDSYATLLGADVAAVEAKLQLSGDQAKQVDAILQDGLKQRLAALDSLGVVYGQKPSLPTLLKLQSQMDSIRTSQQAALSKVLSASQMSVANEMATESEAHFKSALLGS